jgi:hypothetical protein
MVKIGNGVICLREISLPTYTQKIKDVSDFPSPEYNVLKG